jgi:hypothetical protein
MPTLYVCEIDNCSLNRIGFMKLRSGKTTTATTRGGDSGDSGSGNGDKETKEEKKKEEKKKESLTLYEWYKEVDKRGLWLTMKQVNQFPLEED